MSILDLTARRLEIFRKIQNCKSSKDSSKSSKTLKVRYSSERKFKNAERERDKFLSEGAENSIGAERFRPREPAERVAGHRSRIRRLRFRYASTARQVQQVSPAPGPRVCSAR